VARYLARIDQMKRRFAELRRQSADQPIRS
jgi:hypothetical protein